MSMERYLFLYRSEAPETSVPPSEAEIERARRLIHEMTLAGALLAAEGCLPTAEGARVYADKGDVKVVDGPFSDVQHIVSGVLLVQTKSKADATGWAKRLLMILGVGSVEVRRVADLV